MRITVILFIFIMFQFCGRKEPLPKDILGYTLVDRVSGTKAQQTVNQIHLKPVTDTENEIGFYKKNSDEAIIYITHYASKDKAQADLVKMVEKISPQNSVFLDGGQFDIRNVNVYRYFGKGQAHLIFRIENKLFWLSVETMIAHEFLETYTNYLQ